MVGLRESVEARALGAGFSGAIRVDRGDETELSTGFGLAHRGHEIANSPDTQFAVASGGKGFTALAVVSLVEDGTLTMETTSRSLLGVDLPLIADDVTVEHLLAHRSGIGDYLDEEDDDMDLADYLLESPVQDLVTTEAFLPELDGYPTKFPAGERFSYCNGGYVVLALIAERASGVSYHQLVKERVLNPAGLTDTGFLRSDEPSGRMALGYLDEEGTRTNLFHLPVKGNGDGGIYTTTGDMHRFWEALLNNRILSDRWVAEMTRSHSDVPEEGARYGLGFWLDETGPGIKLIGGDTGVSFYSAHDPETKLTWTVVSNTTDGAWPMVRHLSELLGS